MVKKYIIAEKSETNDAEQSIVGWGSRPVPDRDGELVEASAWKLDAYRKNPVLMLSHDYSSPPIGKCLWVKSDSNGLKFKAKFANTERGKELYQLYKDGIMSGFSVGFTVNPNGAVDYPADAKYKGLKRVYKDIELLEISCVAIPACPEALIEQVKAGKIQSKQLKDELEHVIEIVEKANLGKAEVVQKPEVTENYVRIPVKEGDTEGKTIRTMDISKDEGIKALYCVEDKEIITYLFDKEKWSMEEAEKWVEEHKEGGKKKEEDKTIEETEVEIKKEEPVETEKIKTLEDTINQLNEKVAELTSLIETKQPKCPAGETYGESYGCCDQCEECKFAEGCEESSEEYEKACRRDGGKEEEEEKKKPTTKSVYEIATMLSESVGNVIDFTIGSDNDWVLYEGYDRYWKAAYKFNEGKLVVEKAEKVDGMLPDSYVKKEDETITKEGRVLSDRNRKLISNCLNQMSEAITALNELLSATEPAPAPFTNITSGEKEVVIELVETKKEEHVVELIEEKKEEGLEINEEQIREVVGKVIKETWSLNVSDIVRDAIKKAQGKVI